MEQFDKILLKDCVARAIQLPFFLVLFSVDRIILGVVECKVSK